MSSSLTVTEKQHWKNRIDKRIDRRIETLAAEEPGFMDRVKDAARSHALKSLGLEKLEARLERIRRQQQVLEDREEATERMMLATVRGVRVKDVRNEGTYAIEREVSETVEKRQRVHEHELLSKTKRGRAILRLKEEKENLLDTVWLATSPKQIKDLWQKVEELLGVKPTKLERDALAIEPMDAD